MQKRHVLAAMALGILAPEAAYAYLDPATGSVVLQVLVGSAMAGLFVVKRHWRHLTGRLTRRPMADPESTTEEPRSDGDRG